MSDKIMFSLDDLEVVASVGPVNLAHLNERTQIQKRQEELTDKIRRLYAADLNADTNELFAEYRKLEGRLLILNDLIRAQLIRSSRG